MGSKKNTNAADLGGDTTIVVKSSLRKPQGFAIKQELSDALEGKTAGTVTIQEAATKQEPAVEPKEAEVPAAPVLTREAVQQMVQDAIAPVLAASQEKDAQLQAAAEQQQQLEQSLAEKDKAIEAATQSAQAAKEEAEGLKAELTKAQKAESAMESLGKLTGGFPNINTQTSIDASPKGLAADYVNALQSAPSHRGASETAGSFTQRNGKAIANVIRRAKREGIYNSLLKDVETFCKQEFGLFTNAVTGASTGAAGRMPDGFLDILSPFLRETHNQANVWWQFPVTVFDETAVPSKSALVPRWANLDAPTTLADYELGTFDTFTPVGAATGAAGDSESLAQTSVAVTIKEWGRGKGASTRPIYIPEFHEAISLFQALESVVDSRLMQNYFMFEDLLIRTKFQATTQTLYNRRDQPTADATTIAAQNDGGTLTKNFLHSLYGRMHAEQIPAMPNNRYCAVLNSYSAVQLQTSLGQDYRPVSTAQQEEITNMLKVAGGIEIGQVSGYFGSYCGFDIFVSNSSGVGADGSEGAANVTLGGSLGTVLGRDNYFFGVGAVGRGIGMPMEIRPSGVNPYARGESYIWVSHENTDYLDVDSGINAAQQTRVYRVVSLDEAQ